MLFVEGYCGHEGRKPLLAVFVGSMFLAASVYE